MTLPAKTADGRRVLVTGATGFIGSVLVPYLVEHGWTVRATARTTPASSPACDFVAADLGSSDLRPLVEDTCAVVHLAARVHVMHETAADPQREFDKANVTATRRLADAATRCGVRHFVFASSVKVNGERTMSRPYTDADPPAPEDPYGRSKLAAERMLSQCCAESPLGITVLRLPLVYGPGVKGNFARLARLARSGLPLPLGAIANRRSLLFVGNLCTAVHAALERPATGMRVVLLSDGEDVSTPDLLRRMAAAVHRRTYLPAVPVPLLRLAARIAGFGAEFRRLNDSLQVDNSAARRHLQWEPTYSLDEGLALTMTAADC
jgi:nucleoside-diphosphate-sugar epimerase